MVRSGIKVPLLFFLGGGEREFFYKNPALQERDIHAGVSGDISRGRFNHPARRERRPAGASRVPQHGAEQGDEHNRFGILKILKSQRGSVIDFLLTSLIFFYMIFAGVDYYVIMSQHKAAEHIMHYYLERIRVEGYLSTADEAEMINKYSSLGMTVESISCPRQSQGSPRVLRNTADLDASRINLTVTVKPPWRPLTVGLLIGANAAPDNFRIKVGGSVVSERVSP